MRKKLYTLNPPQKTLEKIQKKLEIAEVQYLKYKVLRENKSKLYRQLSFFADLLLAKKKDK